MEADTGIAQIFLVLAAPGLDVATGTPKLKREWI